jgi:hypothetical protein
MVLSHFLYFNKINQFKKYVNIDMKQIETEKNLKFSVIVL